MNEFKLFILNNRKVFLYIAFTILGLAFILIYYFYSDKQKNDLVSVDNIYKEVYTRNEFEDNKVDKESNSIIKEEFISVDIKGRIKKPGVYQINKNLDRRVSDVITMAGGFLNDADTSVTNLAKKLFDEMVIIIYSKEEVKEFSKIIEQQEKQNDACMNECDSCIEKDNVIDNNDSFDNEGKEDNEIVLININKANKEELMTLPGIGESKALAIIEYRNNKLFEKIEDIMNISGIKESAFEKIKNFITV